MNTYASNKQDYNKHRREKQHWPASMLRVVSLDDEKEVSDIEKLFPSESFSLSYSSSSSDDDDDDESDLSSLLKAFEYEDIKSLPGEHDDDMPPTDFSSLFVPPEFLSQWSLDENTTLEGLEVIPLPKDDEDYDEEEEDKSGEDDADSDSLVMSAFDDDEDEDDDSSILKTSTSRSDNPVDSRDEPYCGSELSFEEFYEAVVVPWKFQS